MTDFEGVGIPPDLRPHLNTPLSEIYENLTSDDKNVRGIALELLALRISIDLALMPLRFRERSNRTGGAEVDLLVDAVHLHYSRWLFQCKNTPTVDLADLAKEVGMARLLKGHVVVMVTTGRFARSVQDYADEMMRTDSLQIVLIDGKLLRIGMEEPSLVPAGGMNSHPQFHLAGNTAAVGPSVEEWLRTGAIIEDEPFPSFRTSTHAR